MMNQPITEFPSDSISVAVELLRTGTPHNQLLSPDLTYLALCGDYPPAQFRIALEQVELNKDLRLLRYSVQPEGESVQQAKQKLQDLLTKLVEDIPALQEEEISQLTKWLHLRLVMSPRELAMLPFELTLTPTGYPGERTTPLLLNPERPTTLTREVRQTTPRTYTWPTAFRILFVWAEPNKSVPHAEHLSQLKAAILPWVCPQKTTETTLTEDYDALLTELPQATLAKLRTEVETAIGEGRPYSHVHILAHGTLINDPDSGARFALALHREKKPSDFAQLTTEAVDGDLLTPALLRTVEGHTYTPAVLTIAACDSGNEGNLLQPGGSLAQVLHLAGIPYVLASQFPLSQAGSVKLMADFYPRLLHGEDPRIALYFAREAVAALQPDIHDWASLIAYARFPDTFDEQLKDIRLKVAFAMMKVANTWSEALLKAGATDPAMAAQVSGRLDRAINRLEMLLAQRTADTKNPARTAEHLGLLGSACKRLAEHRYAQQSQPGADAVALGQQSREALEKARQYYRQGHDQLLTNHWTGVQYLSLTAVLAGTLQPEHDRWCVTLFAAENDLARATGQDRVWALGTLAELYLLKPFTVSGADEVETSAKALEKAGSYLAELYKAGDAYASDSTTRQLSRYVDWWPVAFPSATTTRLRAMVEQLRRA